MIAYKAFEQGRICRGHQFVMGLNRTDKANCRQNGFHCAENPLDCLTYYPDMERSEYYIVDAGGDIDEDDNDSKISCTELTVLKKLTRRDFFFHGLAFMADHPLREWSSHVMKDRAEARRGYAVARGIDPVARGKIGDILALAKEDAYTGVVEQIALTCVDGIKIMPDKWYDVDLEERQVVSL